MTRTIRRIAVIGAGPGGIAAAVSLADAGHAVTLYNRSGSRLAPLQAIGGAKIDGDGGPDVLVPLSDITTNLAAAVTDADLLLCCVPAHGQSGLFADLIPLLTGPKTILLAPGSAGSLVFASMLGDQAERLNDELLIGELLTLPQSARLTAPDRVRIRLPSKNRVAAFPACRSDELFEAIGPLLALHPAPNVLDVGLNNVNFIIHPGPMLLNYAAIERADGVLSLMNEGMTPGVLRCMDDIDEEKMNLLETLGLPRSDVDSLYRELGNSPDVYRVPGEPFNLKDRIWPRYIYEDTPCGTVMFSSLGSALGVPTPVSTSVSILLSKLERNDFFATGRTVDALGLGGLDAQGINDYLQKGRRT